MTAVFTRLDFSQWLKSSYLPAVLITSFPLMFKDERFFESVGSFVDTFSAVVASLFIGLLIGHTTCRRNELLAENKKLQDELFKERDQQKEIIEIQAKELSESRVLAEIARATQMLAHDVRKPFSALNLTLNHLLGARTPEQIAEIAKESLPEVKEALVQADELIQDVLDVTSEIKTEKDKVAVEELIRECVGRLFRGNTEIQIETEFEHKLMMIGSTKKLQRVVTNILTNAEEAMQSEGLIRITTHDVFRNGEKFVRVSIWNSGPALPVKQMNDIFELYHTGKSGGHGIGLAIVKKFVNAHGGRVWCESGSSAEGRVLVGEAAGSSEDRAAADSSGVTFSFEIPAIENNTESTHEPILHSHIKSQAEDNGENDLLTRLSARDTKLKILVVDDERLYRESAVQLIKWESYSRYLDVRTASTAEETRNSVDDLNPDLILLDVDLGSHEISGLDLLKQLRANGCNSTICLHSNRYIDPRPESIRALGADAVLPKPIGGGDLGRLVSEVAL
jgi:signal transduction histidine kinase/ActR/RegA family two-component response regulator